MVLELKGPRYASFRQGLSQQGSSRVAAHPVRLGPLGQYPACGLWLLGVLKSFYRTRKSWLDGLL